MTRAEWKAFHHSLRFDARSFKMDRGGYPMFRRHFMHNGAEVAATRYRDWHTWETYVRQSEIRRRPIATLIHGELDCASEMRRKIKLGIHYRRGARVAIKAARMWRLERDTGRYAAQQCA